MPTSPTQQQIQEARAYILQRIDAQHLLEYQLETEFKEAATRIAAIILKYKARNARLRFTGSSAMSREIQQVIDWLEDQINAYVDYYSIPEEATDDEEQEAIILTRIREPDHGYTFDDRETLYLSNYLTALQQTDLSDLMDEDEIIEAINEATEKSHNRLSILALNTVAMGFAFYLAEQASNNNAIGFFVYPGSSNPCDFCIDQHYRFHPITDVPPPYHPNCRCLTIYIYS